MPLSTSRRIAGGFGRQVFLTELERRGLHVVGLARPHPLILTGVSAISSARPASAPSPRPTTLIAPNSAPQADRLGVSSARGQARV
jgi:hypothetical protein